MQKAHDTNDPQARMMSVSAAFSDRRRMSDGLRVGEANFRALSQSGAAAIFIIQGDKFLYANPAMQTVTGYSLDELLAISSGEIVHPDQMGLMIDFGLAQENGRVVPKRHQLEIVTKERKKRWMDFSGTRLKLEGRPAILGVGFDITEHKRTEAQLNALVGQLHALADRLIRFREEERTTLAREIHDELGQALTAIKIEIVSIIRGPGGSTKPPADALRSLLVIVNRTIGNVKRIAAGLRPGILDELDLPAAIQWATEEFQARARIKSKLEMQGDDILLDRERTTALFRIFQEILTNVARHSHATKIHIRLFREGTDTLLEVRDNGVGIQPQHMKGTTSLGILGMRERALAFGGHFEITGRPGQGTTVTVTIPDPSPEFGG